MRKHLTRTGNSVALVLDKPLLEAARMDEDTPVEVSTNGDVIIISPIREKKRRVKFEDVVATLDEKYAGVFRRLAK